MIICFQCDPEIKKKLDILIEAGHYRDYSEAISCALKNEMLLREHLSKDGGTFVLDSTSANSGSPAAAGYGAHATTGGIRGVSVPDLFSLSKVTTPPSKFAPLPEDNWDRDQEIPIDQWLFGQYNRLLPAKANCRALVNLLQNNPDGVAVEETAARVAKEAAALRIYLAGLDERYALDRDELLSTAFPDNSGKSGLRYANQLFCSGGMQGRLDGLLVDLKLIGRSPALNSHVLITEPGWHLAMLPNPVLDGINAKPTQRLSDEEIDLLLEHISHSVAVEDFAYRAILAAINNGANTPDTIDEALTKYLPRDSNRQISQAFRASQRSGAISRMSDLCLLQRNRKGLRVLYVLTERGEKFLNNKRGAL